MASWAQQLENAGQIRDAALAWVSLGSVERAVDVLADHGLRDQFFAEKRLEHQPSTKMLQARTE